MGASCLMALTPRLTTLGPDVTIALKRLGCVLRLGTRSLTVVLGPRPWTVWMALV